MTVFVDTSALYALLDRNDRFHEDARVTWTELLSDATALMTSNYVLVETFALVQRRLGMEAVRGCADRLLPVVETVWIADDDHETALGALLAADRRDLSLVDCASFSVMRRSGIRRVFAFDPHFAEQGFELVPGQPKR